jgi:hypothetical protein
MNGTLTAMFGDNFYHKDQAGIWIQEDSAHSNPDGSINYNHLNTDTNGYNALISEHFYYFGDNAPSIPKELSGICHSTQGHKMVDSQLSIDFIKWLTSNFHRGRHGTPLNWSDYNQLTLF